VPSGGGRRGRRDNGLSATEYEAAGDIDPRIGEHLLDVLAAGGIAAYLQPSTDQHPVTRTTSLPARPTDRLYVDRDHLGTARDYIAQVSADYERGAEVPVGPEIAAHRGPSQADVDDAWREIVAGYHLTVDPEPAPRPHDEEVARPETRPLPAVDPGADPTADQRGWRRVDPTEPSLLDALDTFGDPLAPDDDEGYTPPPPPPLPRISKPAALGTAAILFGLLLFIWPEFLPLSGQTVLVLAFSCVVIGFGTLIWRLRPDNSEDDDFDDGARV
jgi:hypothetical protein